MIRKQSTEEQSSEIYCKHRNFVFHWCDKLSFSKHFITDLSPEHDNYTQTLDQYQTEVILFFPDTNAKYHSHRHQQKVVANKYDSLITNLNRVIIV